MLRTHLTRLAVTVALLAFATQAARANLYLDVQYASGGGTNSTAYNAVVDASHENIVLNVYGLITDAAPSSTVDQFKVMVGNFFVASSTLKGDVSFGSFNSTNTFPADNVAGTQFTTTYGALGLGGSAPTQSTASAWWTPFCAGYPTAESGGSLYTPPTASSPVGVEYLLGTIDVNFDHGLPTSTTTAPMAALAAVKLGLSTKPYAWADSTTSAYALNGSASQVGVSGSNAGYNLLYSSSGAGLNFVFTATGGVTNPGVLAATLGINSTTPYFAGTSLALTGAVSNAGTPTAYNINWNSSTTSGLNATVNPSSGAGVATGTPTPLTGSVALPAGTFGPEQSVVTFTGTDTNGTVSTPVPQTINVMVTGKGATNLLPMDGAGVVGTYYNTVATNGAQAILGLTSVSGTATTGPYGIGNTQAMILAGSSVSTVTEQWRARASNELPSYTSTHGGVAVGLVPLYSDVVNVTGITKVAGGNAATTAPYEMQVTYDPATLGGTAAANAAASNGFLYLGYRTTDPAYATAFPQGNGWLAATDTTYADGNQPKGTQAVQDFQGSYAAYTASVGAGFSLAQAVGAYGVDTANDVVWAVVDHDAEFAAVPEPGTIGLLVAGIAALGFAYRRRKAVKA